MPAAKKSRSGAKFFHGDDLTKTGADRKRRSTTEPWEKPKGTRKAASATKKASKSRTKAKR